jgi:hypothetical protein
MVWEHLDVMEAVDMVEELLRTQRVGFGAS